MMNSKRLHIEDMAARHYTVSVNKYGFFLCLRGTARILLGSKTYLIGANHLCIYTPNAFLHIMENSDDVAGILVENDVEAFYPVVETIDIRHRLRIRSESCVVVTDEQSDEIVKLAEMYLFSDNKASGAFLATIKTDYIKYLGYALCQKIIEVYFVNVPLHAQPISKEDSILNKFLISVFENRARERTVQYYAAQQNLSPYYFSTIIRNRSGKSAVEWIGCLSITLAKEFLEATKLSIKEIAHKLNFPDQSTFGRYFKHRVGMSPSEYRQAKTCNNDSHALFP